jgi:hypothetical protein
MKTKNPNPSADFEYAEFSGDICCPFCRQTLFTPLEGSLEEIEEQWERNPTDLYGLPCKHVGFWSHGSIHDPMLIENRRAEMFELSKALTGNLNDFEDGYHWQETLNFITDKNGNLGQAAAFALPGFQVAVYKHFLYVADAGRTCDYMAVFLKKK